MLTKPSFTPSICFEPEESAKLVHKTQNIVELTLTTTKNKTTPDDQRVMHDWPRFSLVSLAPKHDVIGEIDAKGVVSRLPVQIWSEYVSDSRKRPQGKPSVLKAFSLAASFDIQELILVLEQIAMHYMEKSSVKKNKHTSWLGPKSRRARDHPDSSFLTLGVLGWDQRS